MSPHFTTAPIDSTIHAPLVARGFWVRQLALWVLIRTRVQFLWWLLVSSVSTTGCWRLT